MGAHHEGESFGDDFELPSDRAYSETCAGVAAVQTAQRLLLSTGQSQHADLVERVLYNVVSASPAEDGKAFFYTNTLHQRQAGTEPNSDAPSPRAASSLRAPWFAVSCCPTNVARTLSSLGAYMATVDESGVQIHQYAPSRIRTSLPDGSAVELEIETDYPSEGTVRITVTEAPDRPWALSLRIPGWADGTTVRLGDSVRKAGPGYARIEEALAAGTVVELELPLQPRWTWPHPEIDALRGQVAVECGPVVYCLESVDLGADVGAAEVVVDGPPVIENGRVLVPAKVRIQPEMEWPYQEDASTVVTVSEPKLTPLVPYYSWANRGPSTMRIWMPVAR